MGSFVHCCPENAAVASARARRLILAGKAPAGMRVGGHLDLSGQGGLTELPPGLDVYTLDLSGCTGLTRLPAGLHIRQLNLNGCSGLTELPEGLRCDTLEFHGGSVCALPPALNVAYKLDLQDCKQLTSLPAGMKVDTLILRGCTVLESLPPKLDVCNLDLSDCSQLRALPRGLKQLTQLNVSGCVRLRKLPEGLRVAGWIEVAGAGLTCLPGSLRGHPLLWRSVQIDERIAFRPETLTVEEILAERNAERRRIMIERLGYETFFQKSNAQVVDTDRDAGGERRLLRVRLTGDEDLVCVSVRCPSTGRQYLLRVPPSMRSCRQAAAWMAGFDDPEQYNPLVET